MISIGVNVLTLKYTGVKYLRVAFQDHLSSSSQAGVYSVV